MSELVKELRNTFPRDSGYAETASRAADEIERLTALTRPTPADRPVPQVREALEQEIEKWETDERFDYPDFEVLESLDRILDALTARPSDAAVAWRYRHKDTEGWLMLKNGRDPAEWLKQWPTIEYEVEALAPMRPDNSAVAAELEKARNQLVKANAMRSTIEDIISVYEWCCVDPVDRGYSSLDTEISRARRLLSKTDDQR